MFSFFKTSSTELKYDERNWFKNNKITVKTKKELTSLKQYK